MRPLTAIAGTESLAWFVLCALAVWRVTCLVCYEAGPFDLFTRFRGILIRLRQRRLATCFHCLSLWLSLLVAITAYGFRPSTAILGFGMGGCASAMERWLGQPPYQKDGNENV
jgi:hypothetical protein